MNLVEPAKKLQEVVSRIATLLVLVAQAVEDGQRIYAEMRRVP